MAFCKDCGKLVDECSCAERSRSRERKPTEAEQKKSEEAKTVAEMFAQLMAKADNNQKELLGQINGVSAKIDAVQEEVKDVDAKFTAKTDNHEARIKALETNKTPSGQASVWAGPKHLEVKGFCTWEERLTKGVTKDVVKAFVDDFKSSLPPDKVDWTVAPVIKAARMYKFQVKEDSENIWEIKELWESFVAENDKTLSGETPRFIVERDPEVQQVFKKMGVLYSRLQKKIRAHKVLVPDWRLKQFSIKATMDDGRMLESLVACWSRCFGCRQGGVGQ